MLGSAVDGQFHFTTKDPLGVVVIILPFNYPLCLLCWQAAAAIASGNAVIIKPSDLTSLTTLEFIAAFDLLPAGVVQVLTGGGASASLWSSMPAPTWWPSPGASRPDGSCGNLRAPLQAHADRDFRQRSLHRHALGADRHRARGAAFGAYLNCGQVCAAAERFYVHERVYGDFIERLVPMPREFASATASTTSIWVPSPRGANSRATYGILDGAHRRGREGAGRRRPSR